MATHRRGSVERGLEQPLGVLLDAVPIVVFTIDANGVITYAAGKGFIPPGALAVDIVGRSYRDVYQAAPWLLQAIEQAFGGDIVRAVAPFGDVWIEVRFVPEREDDRIVGVVGLSIDVTEPLRAESLLRAAIDSTADGILVVDRDGQVTLSNRQFAEMWRIPAVVLETRDDERLLQLVLEQLQDPVGFLDRVRELYANPEDESFDVIHFKDGRYFERFSKPQRLDGRVVGRVWSFRDVTQRKRAEEGLQQAVRTRDEFLSIASHELRTPIHSLLLALELLAANCEQPLPSTQLGRTVELATRQAQRLTKLVERLLDVTRVELGRFELVREPVDLGQLVTDVSERFRADLARNGSVLVLSSRSGIVGRWDPLRLEQVLTNLLSNANKFGLGRPVEVSVSCAVGRAAATAIVAVKDHGIGIARERLDVVFERFVRGVSASHFGGLGLGLYVSRKIVEAHGGTLSVTSRIGEGSTFSMELPLDPPSESPAVPDVFVPMGGGST